MRLAWNTKHRYFPLPPPPLPLPHGFSPPLHLCHPHLHRTGFHGNTTGGQGSGLVKGGAGGCLNVDPSGWVTPHYQISILHYKSCERQRRRMLSWLVKHGFAMGVCLFVVGGVCVCIGRVPEIVCQPTLILTFTALSIMEKKGRGWNRGDVGWWRQTLSLKDARWFSLEVGTRPHQITIPRPALNTELQVNKNQQNNEN